jgi:DNA modification methylase
MSIHTLARKPRKPLSEEGKPGRYDPRNTLNDLTGKDWLLLTCSYWITEPGPLDKTAYRHPAPFMVRDVEKLISLFTKKGMKVLDPFAGSATALIAAVRLGRKAIGVDLNPRFREMAVKRLAECECHDYTYILGDAAESVSTIDSVDYVVTSPPYHNILRNDGKGIRHYSGKAYRMSARLGVEYYSEDERDLGNQRDYSEYLAGLKSAMQAVHSKLRERAYCTLVMSDFTVNRTEVCVLSDVVRLMQEIGFEFAGTTVLIQPVKPLFPFGYPYAYKINHHHQNIINFLKPGPGKSLRV